MQNKVDFHLLSILIHINQPCSILFHFALFQLYDVGR